MLNKVKFILRILHLFRLLCPVVGVLCKNRSLTCSSIFFEGECSSSDFIGLVKRKLSLNMKENRYFFLEMV